MEKPSDNIDEYISECFRLSKSFISQSTKAATMACNCLASIDVELMKLRGFKPREKYEFEVEETGTISCYYVDDELFINDPVWVEDDSDMCPELTKLARAFNVLTYLCCSLRAKSDYDEKPTIIPIEVKKPEYVN